MNETEKMPEVDRQNTNYENRNGVPWIQVLSSELDMLESFCTQQAEKIKELENKDIIISAQLETINRLIKESRALKSRNLTLINLLNQWRSINLKWKFYPFYSVYCKTKEILKLKVDN